MKKLLYTLLAGAMALSSCSKSDDMPTASQGEATTFSLSVNGTETRATSAVTPVRYIMEVWSEDGSTAENVFGTGDAATNHAEITSGSAFTVTLDKTKAYTCLFWADFDTDNTAGAFNAASLKAISLNAGKEVTEAYFSKVAVAKGKNPSVAVTLKRAVAKITLTDTDAVKTTDDIVLKLSNIYRTFSVLDAQASGTATEWTKTIKPAATTGTIATFYFFAKTDKELSDLKFTYAPAAERTVSNIPIQQNFATNIRGEFSNFYSSVFTVSNQVEDYENNPEVVFTKNAYVGDFYYKDKTFSSTYTADIANPCIGIVFAVNADGKTGKIVSLDQADKAAWSTESIFTGATSETDGAANTAKVLALDSYTAEKYPAFAWCVAKNTPAIAGINWYLPTQDELKYGLYYNKATLNYSLEKVAGALPLWNMYHWSSRESSSSYGFQFNLNTDRDSDFEKKVEICVRAVSAF